MMDSGHRFCLFIYINIMDCFLVIINAPVRSVGREKIYLYYISALGWGVNVILLTYYSTISDEKTVYLVTSFD